ncbi:MAG: S41 family peptidase [Lachnospiraceae bacterium]|jgi:carboxyl-terminal processing protease|nr:S41 family peptidase [Lachnospiraceae bacterium]
MADYNYNLNGYRNQNDGPYYEKPRSGFGRGVLVGVLCTLLVVFLAGAAFIGVQGVREYLATQEKEEPPKTGGRTMGGKDSDQTQEDERIRKIAEKIAELQDYIDRDYLFEYDEQAILDNICMGMMYGLGDPYSYYYNEEEYASLQESYTGEYYGIGVLVSEDPDTGDVKILRVFEGPAREAGIRKGDILYRVEDLMVKEEDLNTVIARIKGDEGTTVNVEIYREETDEYISVDVERRQVVTEDVEYEMLSGGIGYILLDQFEGQAADQLKAAIDDLESQGMRGLVLDLRDNPGGDLDVMLDIADIFLPRGVVLTMKDVNGRSVPYYSKEQQYTKPLVVLVNGDSASASEALSGAIKDYETGVLVGTQTFGKGIVQSIYTLKGGKTAIKLTTAHYFTPGGTCIHGTGITPDVIVEKEEGETDNQLTRAVEVLEEMMTQ